MKKLRLLRNLMIEGKPQSIDSIVEVSDSDAKYIVARGAAVLHLEGDTNGDGKLDKKEKEDKKAKAKKPDKPENPTPGTSDEKPNDATSNIDDGANSSDAPADSNPSAA